MICRDGKCRAFDFLTAAVALADRYVSLIHLIYHDERIRILNYALLDLKCLSISFLIAKRHRCLFKGVFSVREIAYDGVVICNSRKAN